MKIVNDPSRGKFDEYEKEEIDWTLVKGNCSFTNYAHEGIFRTSVPGGFLYKYVHRAKELHGGQDNYEAIGVWFIPTEKDQFDEWKATNEQR